MELIEQILAELRLRKLSVLQGISMVGYRDDITYSLYSSPRESRRWVKDLTLTNGEEVPNPAGKSSEDHVLRRIKNGTFLIIYRIGGQPNETGGTTPIQVELARIVVRPSCTVDRLMREIDELFS